MNASPSIFDTTPHLQTTTYVQDATTTEEAVRNWHNDVHPGAFWICLDQPCHAVNKVIDR